MQRRIINPSPRHGSRNIFEPGSAGSSYILSEDFLEAVVIDVVVNEEHPKYIQDGYNVGCIRFRSLKTQFFRPESNLSWAFPLDANSEEFPLKNELVRVFRLLNRFYYTTKINLGNTASHQTFPGVASEMGPQASNDEKLQTFQQSTYAPQNETEIMSQLGTYFTDLPEVYRLRHWEGDKIFEGRSGHSIRFGTAWTDSSVHLNIFQSTGENQAPNILLRAGAYKDAQKIPDNIYGRVVEDINRDATSIWMVSDQLVPIELATQDAPVHAKSITSFPVLDGSQVVINSGRVVVNSKNDKIMFHAFDGIHNTTLGDFTVDLTRDYVSYVGRNRRIETIRDNVQNIGRDEIFWTGRDTSKDVGNDSISRIGRDCVVNSGRRVSIKSPKIYIGSESDSSEPLVLGQELVSILRELINAHLDNAGLHVLTSTGPGSLGPGVTIQLQLVLNRLDSILSNDNFVNNTNESPDTPLSRTPVQ